MKKIYSYPFLLATVFVLLSGCEKNIRDTTPQKSDLSNNTVVQVFVATVNATRNFIFVDGNQINGAALSTGSLFPGTGLNSFVVDPGLRRFLVVDTQTVKTPVTTQVPLSFAENMQVGKNYTIFMYDTITTPKQKTVLTDIVIPSDNSARIRFANFIYNPSAVPAIDVYSFSQNANVFTNVAVTDVTNFITYPSAVSPDTLYIRETGSLTNILKVPINLTQKRSYTLVYRGSHRGTRTSTLFINR